MRSRPHLPLSQTWLVKDWANLSKLDTLSFKMLQKEKISYTDNKAGNWGSHFCSFA